MLNKIDRLSEVERRGLSHLHPDAVQVSAVTGEGMDELIETIEKAFESTARTLELLVPYGEGQVVAELYKVDHELVREDVAEGVRITVRVPNQRVDKYARWVVDPAPATA